MGACKECGYSLCSKCNRCKHVGCSTCYNSCSSNSPVAKSTQTGKLIRKCRVVEEHSNISRTYTIYNDESEIDFMLTFSKGIMREFHFYDEFLRV
jgi:protein-arginine kinase activator protein McsA